MVSIPDSRHYHYKAIADGIYVAFARDDGGAFANSGIIDLGDATLIYDTGMTPNAAQDLLLAAKALTGRSWVDYVVNSHYHPDHVRGNSVFSPNATIISSRETRNLLATKGRQHIKQDTELVASRLHELDRRYVKHYQNMRPCEQSDMRRMISWQRIAVDSMSHLTLRLPDVTFDRRLVLNGSRQKAVLIALEGAHTSSDTMLYLPHHDVAFVGDVVADNHHFWLGELDATALEDALSFIAALQLRHIVPGHGPLLQQVPTDAMLGYYHQLHALADNAAKKGISKQEFITTTCPETYVSWHFKLVLFERNLGALHQHCCAAVDDAPLSSDTTEMTTDKHL